MVSKWHFCSTLQITEEPPSEAQPSEIHPCTIYTFKTTFQINIRHPALLDPTQQALNFQNYHQSSCMIPVRLSPKNKTFSKSQCPYFRVKIRSVGPSLIWLFHLMELWVCHTLNISKEMGLMWQPDVKEFHYWNRDITEFYYVKELHFIIECH